MLFLPQSAFEARTRLWSSYEVGEISSEQAFQKVLEIDPDGYIGRKQLIGVLKDLENAEDRKRQKGDAPYDVGKLRVELRL